MTCLYTVGHGDRSQAELLSLLDSQAIRTLVDIRAHPQSGRFPHFSEAALRAACEERGLTYHWAGRQLGGQRPAAAGSRHQALDEGLRGFADYMDSEPFPRAAAQIRNLADRGATAVLCAERDPLFCHRSLLSDYLLLQGVEVLHLIGPGEVREHQLRPEARRESAELIYDRVMT